jgi:hypothetical protein
MGFTEIFLGAELAAGVKRKAAIKTKESKRFTLIPANDRGPPSLLLQPLNLSCHYQKM